MHNCETTDWKTIVSRVRHILLRIILAYCPILQDITRISRRTTITFPSFSSIVNIHLSKNFRIISEMESYESEIFENIEQLQGGFEALIDITDRVLR